VELKKNLEVIWSNFKAWVLLAVSLAGTAGVLYALYDPLDKHFEHWVHDHGHVIDPKNLAVDDRVHIVLTVLTLVLIFELVGLISSSLALVAVNKKKAQTSDVLTRTFVKTVDAAALILKRMFPSAGKTVKRVIFSKQVYTLYDNGDCYATETMILEAGTQNLHFMEKKIEGTADAEAAEFPADINLSIASQTAGKDVTYLITKNEPKEKNFIIFFLPVVIQGTIDRREIISTYHWKGLLKQMLVRRFEDFELTFESVSPIPEVEFEFWAKPGVGEIDCQIVGTRLPQGNETVMPGSDPRGLTGYIYKAQNVPVGHVIELRVTLTRKP
jgi:hypothetical protein